MRMIHTTSGTMHYVNYIQQIFWHVGSRISHPPFQGFQTAAMSILMEQFQKNIQVKILVMFFSNIQGPVYTVYRRKSEVGKQIANPQILGLIPLSPICNFLRYASSQFSNKYFTLCLKPFLVVVLLHDFFIMNKF